MASEFSLPLMDLGHISLCVTFLSQDEKKVDIAVPIRDGKKRNLLPEIPSPFSSSHLGSFS